MRTYQIYCDRGDGPTLDGCWGSENARFGTREGAEVAVVELEKTYPDCKWAIEEEEEQLEN